MSKSTTKKEKKKDKQFSFITISINSEQNGDILGYLQIKCQYCIEMCNKIGKYFQNSPIHKMRLTRRLIFFQLF